MGRSFRLTWGPRMETILTKFTWNGKIKTTVFINKFCADVILRKKYADFSTENVIPITNIFNRQQIKKLGLTFWSLFQILRCKHIFLPLRITVWYFMHPCEFPEYNKLREDRTSVEDDRDRPSSSLRNVCLFRQFAASRDVKNKVIN